MTKYEELLAQAAQVQAQPTVSPFSISDTKKLEVTATAVEKKRALGGSGFTEGVAQRLATTQKTGYGAAQLSQEEQDYTTLPLDALVAKYGPDAAQKLLDVSNQRDQVDRNAASYRDPLTATSDIATKVGSSLASTIGNISAWGAGLVSDEAGTGIASGVDRFNQIVEESLSPQLRAAKGYNDSVKQLAQSDNALKADQEAATYANPEARQQVREFVDGFAITGSNPLALSDSLAQAGGSLLAVPPIAKGLSAIGRVALSKATQGRLAITAATNPTAYNGAVSMLANASTKAATPLSIGLMEGAGAYAETVNEVMGMSEKDLLNTSPEYVKLREANLTHEEAKTQLAASAGNKAGLIQAPVGVLTGTLVNKFEGNPLKFVAPRKALKNMSREATEESLQGISGEAAKNYAVNTEVNPSQALLENVGWAGGESGIAGLGISGVTSTPSLVRSATKSVSDAVVNTTIAALDTLVSIADKKLVQNEANSPVATANLAKQSSAVADALPVVLTNLESRKTDTDPELNQRIDSVISVIKSVSSFSPEDYAGYSEAVQAKLGTSKSKVEELTNLQAITEDESFSEADRYTAGIKLIEELTALEDFVEANTDVLDNIPDSNEVKDTIASLKKVAVNVSNSPQFKKAIRGLAESYAKKHEANPPLQALADPTSVEGQQAITEALAIAKEFPEKSNKEVLSAVLASSTDGSVPLSAAQRKTFQSAYTILDTFSKNNPKGEMLASIDDVTGEAITNKKGSARGDSALSFLNRISTDMANGNTEGASLAMDSLSNFVQHFQNKVAALNKATGQANKIVNYDKLVNGSWIPNGGAVAIRNLPSALNVVTRILQEAETLGLMYNSLVSQFPELKKKEFKLLNPDSIFLDQNNGGIISADALAKNMQWTAEGKNAPKAEPKTEADTSTTAETETAPESVPAEESVPSSVGSEAEAEPAQSFDEVFDNTLVDVAEGILKERDGLEKILSKLKESKALYRALKGTLLPEEVKKLFGNNKSFNFFRSKTGTTLVALIEAGKLNDFIDAEMRSNAFEAADYIKGLLLSNNDKKYMTLEQQEALDKAEFDLTKLTSIEDEKLNRLIDYFFQRSIEEARAKQARKQSARKPKADATKGRTESAPDGKAQKAAEPRSEPIAKPEPVVTETTPVSNDQTITDTTFASTKDEDKRMTEAAAEIAAEEAKVQKPATNDSMDIWYGSGNRAEFSNLASRPFTVNGRNYLSVEHAYQSLKSGSFDEVTYKKYTTSGVKIVGNLGTKIENGWNISLMSKLVYQSFIQNKDAADKLLATGDTVFTHKKDKGIWAKQFPKILMAVRDKLSQPTTKEEVLTEYSIEELSNLPPEELQKSPDQVKKLWDMKKELGTLSSNALSMFGELWSTAGNLLIAGTTAVSDNKPRKQNRLLSPLGNPMEFLREYANERIAGASNERTEAMASLVGYIDSRVNTVKKSLNTIVRDLFVKNDEATLLFTQLLQENPIDNIREGKSLVHRFPRYRIFSILSPSDKSPIPVLNEKLLELAALAYAQWELTLQNYKGHVETKDVASLLGIEESAVTPAMVAEMQNTTTFAEAQASLGKLIMKYWSLEPNKDAPSGFHEGIAGSLALEIIKAIAAKDNTNNPRMYIEERVTATDEKGKKIKSINIIKFNKPAPNVEAANKIFSNLIEEASFAEYDAPMYFGDNVSMPVSDTVLRSPNQKLTDQQKAAQKNEQDTPHFLNMLSYQLYSAIGLENIYRLRKLPNSTEEKVLNRRTLQTVVGQKKGISAAFDKTEELFFGLQEAAKDGDMEQTPIRYKYEFISTGRLQMSGPQNPQANKMMRHVVLPTKDTVDLTNADMLSNFELAVAQGLGVRVGDMPRSKMKAELLAKVGTLTGKKAIEGLQEWSKNPADPMSAATLDWLSEFFGSGFSDAGLFALLEYSRFLGSSKQELANFTTSIYVEADGVNNGPAAAMYMMGAIAGVTEKWLANMARTGYFISTVDQKDEGQRMSLNKYRHNVDKTDLYGITGKLVPSFIQEMLSKASKEGYIKDGVTYPSGQRVAVATLEVIRALLPGVTLSVVGDIVTATIDRSVPKNPMTSTVYGSGPTSTAVNLTKEALDNFYSKLSDIALARLNPENTATDDDLYKQAFGVEYTKLFANIEFISKNKLIFDKKSQSFFSVDSGVGKVAFDKSIKDYLLTDAAVQTITNNIKHTFAVPIKSAIKEETGTVLDGSAAIIKITQTTGALMAREFNRLYDETVAKSIAGTRNYQKSDGISINDLRKIEAEMRKMFPFVTTSEQTFDISKSEMLPLDKYSIGRTLDENTKVHPSVMVPTDPGVAGIPYLVIGLGDGRMMQFMAADSNGPQNTLKIYDGMHMKVSSLKEDSIAANKAVWEAWQGNPFTTLESSFLQFVRNYDWKSLVEAVVLDKEEGIRNLGSKFGVTYEEGIKQTFPKVSQEIASFLNSVYMDSIRQNGIAIDATHDVLSEFQTSIDQMASAGAPYLHNPDGRILDTTDPQYLEKLNAEISAKKKQYAAQKPAVNVYTEVLAKMGAAPVLKPTTVKDVLSKYAFKNAGAALTAAISKVAGDVPVFIGSADLISAKSGYVVTDATNAFYDVNSDTIYIVEGRISEGEAALHEAIHAATYAIVANYYTNPAANTAVANTITNLEKLMKRFLAETESNKSAGVVSARASILSATKEADKLNEFMAWGLSNKDSRSVLSKISSLVRQFVFKLFNVNPTAISKNLYEELVFETLSLLDTGVTSSMGESDVLFHNTAQSVSTGDRIKDVSTFFYKVIGKHMENMAIPGLQAQARTSSVFTTDPIQFDTATLLSANATALLSSKFPGMTAEELDAASAVINALALSYKLDGNSLLEVEKLYNSFIKDINVNDFLLVPEQQASQADFYEASEMFNVITGKFITGKDTSNRGQVLPIFFALALTNQRFRAMLSKRTMPKGSTLNYSSTDDLLQSTGTALLEKLDNKLSGVKPNSNLQQAIDTVFNNLAKNAEERFGFIEAVSDKTGSVIDGLNDKTTQAVSFISNTLERKAKAVKAGSTNKVIKGIAGFAELGSRLLTDSKAAAVAEGLLSGTNQVEGFKPLRELMVDFIGRTQSNQLIYDMVKYVRSMVQQDRQDYRENLPSILAKKFTKELTKQQWSDLFNGIAKTDFAHLVDLLGTDVALSLLNDPAAVASRIRTLESDLRTSSRDWVSLQKKIQQLAKFMNTGKAGSVLLRNAIAINKFHGGDITKIDSLVTLYALRDLNPTTKDTLSSLVQTEKDGLVGLTTYLVGLRKDEASSSPDVAINAYKGYIPSLPTESAHLIVANDTSFAELTAKSYVRIGDYRGSNAENSGSKGYYLLKAPYRAAFSQGLMQNIHDTAGGVDIRTRLSVNNTSGAITEQNAVNRITRRLSQETGDVENLLPVFNADGTIYAYERSLDPTKMAALEKDTHLAKMMGVWRGRQVEEAKAQEVNKALIDNLHTMFTDDLVANPNNIKNYINLATSTDPVHIDALRLMPPASRRHIEGLFGKGIFMVRRDMVNNAIGYRTPSVGDAWTGISGWSQETLDTAQKIAISLFGNKAYEYLVNNEQILKNLIQDAKLIIVVKSVVVPVGNILSNIMQLVARGVPLKDIARNAPKKLSEINFYTKQRVRKIEAEAELLSAKGDVIATTKLQTELDSIEDSFRRLSIWPLIEAGEFSAISDVGISRDDILLTEGRLHAYIERLTDKLPEGAKTFAKYGLVTKDTALFQGMQKAVEYGDFLAKALRYDHLLSEKKTNEQALAGITEEFVNYDLLPGRFREYGENVGLWWFTAFKVRSFKIALSIIRNNPVQALLAGLVPIPSSLGVGSPLTDNAVSKALDGTLGYSLGWGQALRAPGLNPWHNLVN